MTHSDLEHELTSVVEGALHEADVPGATVAVLLDGRLLLQTGVGFRDAEQTMPLSPDATTYLYSITKSFLATAILQLADRGALRLDEEIQTYLPGLFLPEAPTVRQLLNHSGGLPDYGGLKAYRLAVQESPRQPWTADQFLQHTLAQGMAFAPGTDWAYSNLGYMLLKQLLEQLAGLSLHAALQQLIFSPFGLHKSCVAETVVDAAQLTPGYSTLFSNGGALEDVRHCYHPGWVAHGVVIATAQETAHFLDALLAGRCLSPERLQEMLVPVTVPGQHPLFVQAAYGLGLMIDARSPYGVTAGHAGGGPGYSTAAFSFSNVHSHRVTLAALANRDHDNLGLTIVFRLVDYLDGRLQ